MYARGTWCEVGETPSKVTGVYIHNKVGALEFDDGRYFYYLNIVDEELDLNGVELPAAKAEAVEKWNQYDYEDMLRHGAKLKIQFEEEKIYEVELLCLE